VADVLTVPVGQLLHRHRPAEPVQRGPAAIEPSPKSPWSDRLIAVHRQRGCGRRCAVC
jgi:hypothetical protein